jgi:hydrogenase maturation protease
VKILVAGVGNIFQGDDAFGCEVVKRLAARSWPEDVRLFDFGIRGLDLTYALMDDPDLAILIDATRQGDEPGTVYLIEPSVEEAGSEFPDAHSIDVLRVLRMARPRRVFLVGCEPLDLGGEEGRMGLTAPVAAAVIAAAEMVADLVEKELVEVTV